MSHRDFIWRPHRFFLTTIGADEESIFLMPDGAHSIIETINIVLDCNDTATATVLVNSHIVMCNSFLGSEGQPIIIPLSVTNQHIPLWAGDTVSVTASGDVNSADFCVVGKTSGWVGEVPTDGLP